MSEPDSLLLTLDAAMAGADTRPAASPCGDKPGSSGPAASPCGDKPAEGTQQCDCGDKPAEGCADFRPESAKCACLVRLFARLDAQIAADRKRGAEAEAAQQISTRRAAAAKRRRLDAVWEYWKEQAADVDGLQFGDKSAAFGDKPADLEMAVVSEMQGGRIYVGATCEPVRRWQGGWVPRADGPPTMMRGHERTWDAMKVVAVEEGLASARLEARLIRFAKARFGVFCANKFADARGLSVSSDANFIYVCT